MSDNCGNCFVCLDRPHLGLRNPTNLRMVLCPECGNKRCPHSTDHRLACTGSNEPGQPGSRYGGMTDRTCWTCHHDDTRDVFCAVLDDDSKRKRGTKRAIRAWLDEQPKHGCDGCRPGGPAKGYPPKLATRPCPRWVAGRDYEGGDDV